MILKAADAIFHSKAENNIGFFSDRYLLSVMGPYETWRYCRTGYFFSIFQIVNANMPYDKLWLIAINDQKYTHKGKLGHICVLKRLK